MRVTDISEEHARECGFEDEKVNEFPPVRSAKSPLYEAWLALGRSGADWVWSVAVERWVNAEHEMQHPDAPTWCIHCGTFSTHVETTKCTENRSGKWDARKNPRAMIQSILGKLVPEVLR